MVRWKSVTLWDHATTLPEASSPALSWLIEAGWYRSFSKSSRRDHTTWTGFPIAFESSTASGT
jgi:hypothetical protein